MTRRPSLAAGIAVLFLAPLSVCGCLPGDSRPPPGSLEVQVEGNEALLEPLETSDGWSVTIVRLLVALGTVELHGSGCNPYDQAHYSRIFDFTMPLPESQKLALVYGLGSCSLEFRIRAPHVDAVLGPGVRQSDIDTMRIEIEDGYGKEPQRTSVWVRGVASRGSSDKHFDWQFRRRYNVKECTPGPDGQPGSALEIEGGASLRHTVRIDGSQLLRLRGGDEAVLEFDPFAAADTDGDGAITLDELAGVSAPDFDDPHVLPAEETADFASKTLAQRLYDTLVPQIASLAGAGRCNIEIDDRRW